MSQLALYEFGEAKPLPPGISPAALQQYLQRVWQNRYGLYQYGDEEPLPFGSKQPFLQFEDSLVQARNYAGIIHFQGLTIYLIPKVFQRSTFAGYPAEHGLLAHLSFYLSYCSHVRFPFQWLLADSAPTPSLAHWIHYFASFTASTLAQHPYLAYQTHTRDTAFLRGKLAVQPYLNQQILRGQWQRLQTEQQPFELNNLFNQIVKHTVVRLQTIADTAAQPFLEEILWVLADVEDLPCTAADCDAVHLNRLYTAHQQILDMCRFFLAGESAGESSSQAMNFAFLVPMERIFEDFIAGFVQRHFPEWQAEFQKSMPIGVRNETRPVLTRADIWLPLQRTVWDTKYKIALADNQPLNVASADLYQMLAYAAVYQIQNVHLLYAATTASLTETIHCHFANAPVSVHIHAIPMVLTSTTDTFSGLILRLKETLQKAAEICQ